MKTYEKKEIFFFWRDLKKNYKKNPNIQNFKKKHSTLIKCFFYMKTLGEF